MNDPSIDAERKTNIKGTSDGDTCRICRGEGSRDEPLFFPCKCSGSIKFVHQACLMEWLSHSQKKHCELCKTPFRFTKLYDPHMPKSVPHRVFLKQAAVHVVRALMTWSRWTLVLFVWLGWVPWCMRTIWRGLFWVADGAWITRQEIERYTRQLQTFAVRSEASTGNRTSDLSNIAPSIAGLANYIPKWAPVSQTLNYTAKEPAILWLSKRLISGFVFPYSAMLPSQSNVSNSTLATVSLRAPSVLSDVRLLRNLTRSNTINNITIDILEGQLITLSIVVTFILVFLIREWVVQQQPMVNFGAGVDGARALEVPGRRGERVADPVPPPDANHAPEEAPVQGDLEPDREENVHNLHELSTEPATGSVTHEEQGEREDASGAPNQPTVEDTDRENRIRRTPATDLSLASSQTSDEDHNASLRASSSQISEGGVGDTVVRPSMPAKDIVAQATNIQRTLEEEAGASGKLSPGVDVFMDFWNRADGDPRKALDIIEQEGLTDQAGWIVPAMRRLQKPYVSGTLGTLASDGKQNTHKQAPESSQHGLAGQEGSMSDQRPEHRGDQNESPPSEHNQPDQQPEDGQESQTVSGQVTPPGSSDGSVDEPNDPNAHALGPSYNENSASGPAYDFDDSHTSSDYHRVQVDERRLEANEAPTFRAMVREWLWGGLPQPEPAVEDPDGDDEHVVHDIADEAPFVPVADGQLVVNNIEDEGLQLNDAQLDPEVVRAAADAGIDPNEVEAIEEGEDLEGVMELIGVQGPLGGLVQNAMFSTVLISLTVLFGLWLPYILGKLILVFMANPMALLVKMPLRWISTTADIVVDSCIFFFGCAFYWLDRLVRLTAAPLGFVLPFVKIAQHDQSIPLTAHRLTWSAWERLAKNVVSTSGYFSDLDIPIFSIVAHESLINIEDCVLAVAHNSFAALRSFAASPSPGLVILKYVWLDISSGLEEMSQLPRRILGLRASLSEFLPNWLGSSLFTISLDVPTRTTPFDYELSMWSIKDRAFTIIVGYIFISAVGAVYLKLRRLMKDLHPEGEPQDGVVIDVLNQSAGVLKVILIITIEMIVFPLYCGTLLDIALLPLFDNTTIVSRLTFTANSPLTSLFVHWFVGTCYMFHFALFVSMCRRIMRSGVLYFIRDPDDPSFHPVRDVLERNVSTQLRKILFSALVYGGLVIVCLGAVVWGLSWTLQGVFPIHWSSNEPVLQFPVDLLVYNFLMPVAIRFFKPSDGLHSMYKWWFKKCARVLRLSHFLFDERRDDEEGHYIWTAEANENPLEQESDAANDEPNVDIKIKTRENATEQVEKEFGVEKAEAGDAPETEMEPEAQMSETDDRRGLAGESNTAEVLKKSSDTQAPDSKLRRVVIRSGRLVRAPASDQVRIPKGSRTFIEIDNNGHRLDGLPDNHHGLHGSQNKMFATIYVPPHFRLRIIGFIMLLWLFAAATGVSLTIIPLMFGRYVFSQLIPSHPRMNDVYAFAIGIYLLGGPLYVLVLYGTSITSTIQRCLALRDVGADSIKSFMLGVFKGTLRFLRLVYFYGAFTLLLPSLLALVFEAYLLVPLHTYFTRNEMPPVSHTVHFVSDWTLGVLYVRVGIRLILQYRDTRPSRALRALVSHQNNGASWFNPDIWLATRAFILPLTFLLGLALLLPLGFGWFMNVAWFRGASESLQTIVYRYSYPAVLFMILAYAFLKIIRRAVGKWKSRVRDEVYLIGERLHNFGDKMHRVNRVATRG